MRRTLTASLFVSSDFAAAVFLDEHRAETQFVIDQSESVFLRKLRDFGLPIWFVFWPHALQFIFVDSAIAELIGFQPQLTPD